MKKLFVSTILMALVFSTLTPAALAQDMDAAGSATSVLAEHVPGELLVRFSPRLDSVQIANKMAEMGVTHKREVPAIGVYLVKLRPGLSVERAITSFNGQPGIDYVEPNYILHIAREVQAEIVDQWGLTKINAQEAWATLDETQKNEVLVATVDTGIDSSQSDLSSRIWYFPGETPGNGIDDDGNGYVDDTWGWDFFNNDNNPSDDNMHGTAVSSVIAADEDGAGMVGVCPWCRLMAVKVLGAQGSGSLDVVANGITYAAQNGARVINLSLGGSVGSQTLESAVNFAWEQGAVVVAAAGNNGAKITFYPAGYAKAMSVGSTNSEDKHSCFSNYNDEFISVTAPGEGIYVIDINNSETGYGYYSGTSLATPHVSGLAGLILGKEPTLDRDVVRSIIENSAVDLGSPGEDSVFGHGRIDAYRALTGDYTQNPPPDGLYSVSDTASGFSNSRKMVRDRSGKLHVIWHTFDGSLYRIRYATSIDDGSSWDLQSDVFTSIYETYHSALAADDDYLYVAMPSRIDVDQPYQILFTRKPIAGGAWLTPESLMGGSYNAVRPDIYVDPSNGRVHLIASSYDDTPYLYYRSSNTQGETWGAVSQFNPSNSTSNTRYATLHANGDNIYIATKTVSNMGFYTYFYLYTARSTDGGLTWIDQTQISWYLAFTTSEYGVSLAGIGDRVYMAYEVGSYLFFRRYDGVGWSDYLELEVGDPENVYKWPTITQAEDGQAWMLFEVNKQLYMRYYDGSNWQAKENIGPGTYPNLKLGTGGDQVEWVYTSCNGSPFDLAYGSHSLGANSPPQAYDQSLATDEDVPLDITLTASDPEGAPLTYSVVAGPTDGALSGTPPSLTYTPNADYNGSDSFTFKANDGQLDSNIATVSISIAAVNDPPVAENQAVSTSEGIPVDITLTASDPEGAPLTYSVVAGPTDGVLSGTPPNLTYTPNAGFNGSDGFTFKANDGQLDSNVATVSITVDPAAIIVDALANNEVFIDGTVSGNYTATHADGGNVESITEIESGGKPQNRYSLLEHKWIFNVTPGNAVTLFANAWSGGSADGDGFTFSFSMDDISYIEMFTVDYTSDSVYEIFALPVSTQGTVYVRVIDSNRSPGSRDLDTVYVDHLYIRSETQPGNPPAAPTSLNATVLSATLIDLVWTDNATDEYGFQIERSLDGVGWTQIDTVGADVASYADATVLPSTTYFYRVQAYNGSGTSDHSNTAEATTPDGISLQASGYKIKGVQTVDLAWGGSSASSFDIYRDSSLIAEAVGVNFYTDNIGQKGGGSYFYQVCEAGSMMNCSNIARVDF